MKCYLSQRADESSSSSILKMIFVIPMDLFTFRALKKISLA